MDDIMAAVESGQIQEEEAERRLNEIYEKGERSRKSKMSQKSDLENTSSRDNSSSPPAETEKKMSEVVNIGEDREEEYSLCNEYNESIAEITVKTHDNMNAELVVGPCKELDIAEAAKAGSTILVISS